MNQPGSVHEEDFEITIEDDWVRIRIRPGKVVTSDFVVEILKSLYSMEAYRSQKKAGLWDFRKCNSDLDYHKIAKIKSYITKHYDPGWSHKYTAIVADEDFIYGLSRMYEIMTDDIPTTTHIFRDMDTAQNWLKRVAI